MKPCMGQMGESLVVAELGRRGIRATAFAGNVPVIDLLAYANDTAVPLQVKSFSAGSIQFHNVKRFINIEFEGDRQIILGLVETLNKDLIFVLVKIGKNAGQDRYFILLQGDLQKLIKTKHSETLEKHDGVRPKNPKSMHTAVKIISLEKFEDNWALIEKRFGVITV